MKRGRSTLVLLVVAALLGGYIYFGEMRRPDPDDRAPEDRVFAELDAGSITSVTVRAANGDETTVERDGAGWRMTAPVQARADAAEVAGVTSNLASLDRSRVIDEAPDDLSAFGLDDPRIAVGFSAETGEQTLLLGSRTVTGGDMYAKLEHEPRVFLVPSWLESSFDRTTFQLRDKTLATFDRTRADAISIIGTPGTIEFEKQDGEWRLRQPVDARADSGTVEGLLGRLSSGQMQAIVADAPATLDVYGLRPARTTVTVSGGGERLARILIGSPSGETAMHAMDDTRPLVFTVDTSVAADLERSFVEYRPRSLFTTGLSEVRRLAITRAGEETRVIERDAPTAGEGGPPGAWRQTAPAADVDPQQAADLVSAVQTLRAETWESRLPARATPMLTIELFAGAGEPERLRVFRAADRVLAEREGEPGAAVLAIAGIDRVVDAMTDLMAATEPEGAP
jgi:hypothetical protein